MTGEMTEQQVAMHLAALREAYMEHLRALSSMVHPDFGRLVSQEHGFRKHLRMVETVFRRMEETVTELDKYEKAWIASKPYM